MRLLIYVALMSLATNALANNIIEGNQGSKIKGSVVERFQNPWAMISFNNVIRQRMCG